MKNSRYLILKAAFSVVFPAFKSFFVGEMLFESSIKAVDGKKNIDMNANLHVNVYQNMIKFRLFLLSLQPNLFITWQSIQSIE